MNKVRIFSWRRVALAVALASLAAMAVSTVGAIRADTAAANYLNCSPSSTNCPYCNPYGRNYYGTACLKGSDFSAVQDTVQSAAFNVSDSGADLLDNDTWIVNTNSGDPHWIEAGMFTGSICKWGSGNIGIPYSFGCSAGSGPTDNIELFWVDDRASCECYYGHLDTSDPASLNTPYEMYMFRLDSQDWGVDVGQNFGGTSTSNTLTPDLLRAGTEESPQSSSSNYITACSEQYNLRYWDSNGNYHDGWSDSTNGDATLESDAPPYAWWVNTDQWVRDRSNDPTCYGG
jgi:hypothetical protein